MKKLVFLFLPILFLGACRSPNYISTPMDFKHQVKGLIFEVKLNKKSQVLGEIIEVNEESILILPVGKDNPTIRTILKDDIKSAEIIISGTSDNPKGIGAWAALINLASVGHGFFMVISVPVNLATTISIGSDAAKGTYRMKYPDHLLWQHISKFARFPQGIPDHIDIERIK